MRKPATWGAAFEAIATGGLKLPGVEATTDWSGAPVLRVRGCFMAGLASHRTAEPDTLVVRCALDDRERLIEDAGDTYYVTDFYRPYPVVLVRLSQLPADALRDLLSISWRMTLDKLPRSRSGTRSR